MTSRLALLLLLSLAGCGRPAAPAPVATPGELITVRSRLAIYYDERLFAAVCEVTRSGSNVTPELDPMPTHSNCDVLFRWSELRVLAAAGDGVKVLLEKYSGENAESRPGRIGWIAAAEISRDKAEPIPPPGPDPALQ